MGQITRKGKAEKIDFYIYRSIIDLLSLVWSRSVNQFYQPSPTNYTCIQVVRKTKFGNRFLLNLRLFKCFFCFFFQNLNSFKKKIKIKVILSNRLFQTGLLRHELLFVTETWRNVMILSTVLTSSLMFPSTFPTPRKVLHEAKEKPLSSAQSVIKCSGFHLGASVTGKVRSSICRLDLCPTIN